MTDGDADRFDVSPHLVHRTHGRDLFLSTVRSAGPDHFEVSARWPANHPFYGPADGRHDPLLLLETVRQVCLAVGHGGYGIPRDTPFIVRDKKFEVDSAALRTAGDEPVDLLVDMTTAEIERRGRAFTGMRFDATCGRDGTRVGTGSYRVSFASAGAYRRLRGPYYDAKPALACAAPPVRPEVVGRADDIDVLLAEAPGTSGWCLRIDPAHPVLFDHVMDHVPGNVIVEAARQAAYLATGRPGAILVRAAMSFARYIEFDTPCTVLAEQAGARRDGLRAVAVTFTQGGHVAADGLLELLG
jgi:2-oxo-3-(phosphooxy)propyl 3-oxoalkanoate synthase